MSEEIKVRKRKPKQNPTPNHLRKKIDTRGGEPSKSGIARQVMQDNNGVLTKDEMVNLVQEKTKLSRAMAYRYVLQNVPRIEGFTFKE